MNQPKSREVHVHVGVSVDHTSIITAEFPVTYVDGDGWESWGDKPNVDMNDATTAHVIVNTSEPEEVIATLFKSEIRGHLEQMNAPYQRGTLIVVTDRADWSDVLHSIKVEGEL